MELTIMRESLLAVRYQDSSPFEAVILTVEFREEATKWLAECLELGTATYGDTLDEAREDLRAAVLLHLNEVQRLGFAHAFLEEHGVKTMLIGRRPTDDETPWLVPAAK